jgi:hypothetical protein
MDAFRGERRIRRVHHRSESCCPGRQSGNPRRHWFRICESPLEIGSIDQNPDGAGVCTYTAHFDDIPANQRSYNITVTNFGLQSFTSDELESGATYRLLQNAPPPASAASDLKCRTVAAPSEASTSGTSTDGFEYQPAPPPPAPPPLLLKGKMSVCEPSMRRGESDE